MSFNVKQVISMPFEWTQNLSIGVAEIDNQHKELFKRINNLLDAISQGKGKQELFAVLEFLEDYSKFHFADLWYFLYKKLPYFQSKVEKL